MSLVFLNFLFFIFEKGEWGWVCVVFTLLVFAVCDEIRGCCIFEVGGFLCVFLEKRRICLVVDLNEED